MEERKSALIEALAAKCSALLELQQAGDSAPAAAAATSAADTSSEQAQVGGAAAGAAAGSAAGQPGKDGAFEAAFKELRKWVDTATDEKVGGVGWGRGLCAAWI